MRLRLVSTTCVLAALFGPHSAASAHVDPYVRFDLGHSLAGKLKLTPATQTQQDIDLKTNLLSGAALGLAFDNGIRLELEANHRKNGLVAFEGDIDHGDMVADTIMGNLYYDFLRGAPIRPYVGVGAGAIKVDLSTFHSTDAVNINTSKTMPAYQAMVGVTVPLSRRLSIDAGYRYLATQGVDMAGLNAAGAATTHKVELNQSTTRIGLTYRFGGDARPAPPQPTQSIETQGLYLPSSAVHSAAMPTSQTPQAPQANAQPEVSLSDFETSAALDDIARADDQSTAAGSSAGSYVSAPVVNPDDRTFVVHFEFDKAELTLQAVGEISVAANYANERHAKSVTVSGYTDRSGGIAYNLRLSKRRALVVVNALLQDGVDPTLINYVYHGEADPVVETRNGVPEPLNRRTQIDIAF